MRRAVAQFRYRLSGADHRQMEKLRASACAACQGWPADRVTEIVSRHLKDLILPYVYAEARALLSEHRGAGQNVIIVSTSGQEVAAPIGALLGAESVIATRMRIANGHYTGEMECYTYGEEKAVQVRRLAAERGYSLPGCYAYSDSVTDLPLLEAVGNPRVVNPDRALRRIATVRGWPVLSFSTAERHSAHRALAARRQARHVLLQALQRSLAAGRNAGAMRDIIRAALRLDGVALRLAGRLRMRRRGSRPNRRHHQRPKGCGARQRADHLNKSFSLSPQPPLQRK